MAERLPDKDTQEAPVAEPVEAVATPEPEPTPITRPENDTWIGEDEIRICEKIGARYGLSPELLEAIIETESSGKQYARNGECIGLMQVNVRLHSRRMRRLGYNDLYGKEANIATGTDLLAELIEKNGVGRGLMAYNGVPDARTRTSVTAYAGKILMRQEELERLHGKRQ